MTLTIRTARHEADLAAVRSLRNQAFVTELGLAYDALDDRIDEYSTILIGERDGEVLASMRLTRRSDGPLEDEGPLDLALWTRTLGDHELFQASRFVIAAAARAGSAQLQMITAAYRRIQAEGGRLCFIDCDPALARYYLRLGFRRFSPSYPHPILRHPYLPLVSFIGDLHYFRRTRALLGRVTERDEAEVVRRLFERHADPSYLFPDPQLPGDLSSPFEYYLRNETLAHAAREFEHRELAAGETFELRERLAVVESGVVRLDQERDVPIRRGEHLGLTHALGRAHGPLRVTAIEHARLLILTREQLVAQLMRYPALALNLLRGACSSTARAPQHTPALWSTRVSPRGSGVFVEGQ